ncbi:CHASE2 domain-containing protein [Denitrobaculum tricleocarpae]|uniref:histidine kinase n=1 Tax=Denitrobaculum tricleocarpae TaxID=2591009 RepID=A0A545TFF2_9PROT|nr:CHASE2 domain-containing protein [Denitrobaculum tricleocarpae]TQV75896.1 CHASE2 domain-containing protein [Denitrobaculum tricleocarpae]
MLPRSFALTFRNWRVALVLLPLAIALRIFDPWPVEQLRLQLFDLYQEISPRTLESYPVVVIDIDETSMSALGQWPWPRSLLAELVDFAAGAEVHAIGFDILFPDRDRLSPDNLIRQYQQLAPDLQDALSVLPSNDAVLANSIARAPVVLGVALSPVGLPEVDSLSQRTAVFEKGDNPREFMVRYGGVLGNIALIGDQSRGQGIVSLATRRDSVVRRLPAVVRVNESLFPAFSVELLRVAAGVDSVSVFTERAGIKGLSLAGQFMPTDGSGQFWPHFSRHDPARFISARDVLNGSVDPGLLAGKFVLIGTTAAGLGDLSATPVGENMSGVEIHAQMLETLLTGGLLLRPNFAVTAEIAVTLIISIFLVSAHARGKAISTIAFSLVLAFAVVGSSWLLFALESLLLDATYPLFVAMLLYVFLISGGFLREERERRRREERLRELQDELINVSRVSAMSQLSSALAHELNQPLTAIINYIQASRRVITKASEAAPPDGAGASGPETIERVGSMMSKALTQAERAGGIIRGLRGTFEKREATRAPEELAPIIEEAILLGQIGSTRNRVDVKTVLSANLPPVDVNRIQVQQVIVNLVRNAVEAVSDSQLRRVTVEAFARSAENLEVVVADSGPGVTPEVKGKLFKSFVTTKDSGMGIGLSICHSIVEMHGGEMWLGESADGGAAFHFTLPVAG